MSGVAGTVFRHWGQVDPCWDSQKELRDADIAASSARLHDSIKAMFFRFERQHGLQKGEAQVLLLDVGVRL